MRKLIAVLEGYPARVEEMASWLDDRFYMYDRSFHLDPSTLAEFLRSRLGDVLVLCLGLESLGGTGSGVRDGWHTIVDLLGSWPARFPILVHFEGDAAREEASASLSREGWDVRWIGPIEGPSWVGSRWYPAVKKAVR